MNNDKVDWRGNFPAAVTPFTKDGEIDFDNFASNLEMLREEGADGFVVSGSTGEAWSLRPYERVELFKKAKEVVGKEVPIIGGTSAIRPDDVVEMTHAAKAVGIDGVMVMPSYYAHLDARCVLEHFETVSDGARFPILAYNAVGVTGFNMTAAFCEQLADIEYVVALKQSCPDFIQLQDTIATVGERINVFSGVSAKRGMAAVAAGACGFISAIETHIMGREGFDLYRTAMKGDFVAARSIQSRTLALFNVIDNIGAEPSSIKAAMNLRGRPGGHVRRPVLDLSEREQTQVWTVLNKLGLM